MKAEGSAPSITIQHKVKVKEETKECNYQPENSPVESQVTTTMAVPVVGGSTNTITTTSTTNSNSVANLSNHLPSTGSNSSTNEATSPTSTHQNSSVICQVPSSTSSLHNSVEPVDLDVKSKGAVSAPSRDDRGNNHSTKENRSSPQCQKSKISHTSAINGHSEFSRQLSASSSGNDSPVSSHSIKPEDEPGIGKHEEPPSAPPQLSTETTTTTTNGVVLNGGGLRCISSVFAGHAKLKRLLGTLVQFANNISTETGDTVRCFVFGLLSGAMTAEEFHSALQEATNFPLRDFVLPYLRHTLPSLRRNLNAAARANNQTCMQYLRANESAILETVNLPPSSDTAELFGDHSTNGTSSTAANYSLRSGTTSSVSSISHSSSLHHYGTATNLATKRRASDTPYYENGSEDSPLYGKRSSNIWGSHHHPSAQQQSDPYCWYHPLHSSSTTIQGHSHHPHVPPNLIQINQLSSFGAPHHPQQQQQQQQQQQINHAPGQMQNGSSLDDEWKNIHVMLNCILGMVEKTKRALVILQRRGCPSPAGATPASGLVCTQNGTSNGNNLSGTNGAQIESSSGDRDGNLKRLSGEIVAQTIRATEDRVVTEVKRRAEAVQEVKRTAMVEVQRAVAAAVAESRASERMRVQHLLDIPLAQRGHSSMRQGSFLRLGGQSTSETISKAASSTEDEKEGVTLNVMGSSCWNCGRPALETCGGCGIARYCGSFCQHRDWETGGHHATCRASPTQEPSRSSSRSPPRPGNSSSEIDSAAPTVAKGK
ncbi:protein CBFA2T1 isoform X2 [Diachasmimorpha longicaudata]|uniref:protein CBFA2T1 isoform X2 n=1 Tax=Diachasmimorpha longicaudata TaxID=58733 RepID=UPI0030B8B681